MKSKDNKRNTENQKKKYESMNKKKIEYKDNSKKRMKNTSTNRKKKKQTNNSQNGKSKSRNMKKNTLSNHTRKKKIKRQQILMVIWNFVFYISVLIVFTSSVMLAIMQQQDKSLAGYRAFGVLTNSMVSPDNTLKKNGFRAGDIIIIKESSPKKIKIGDVITYRPSTNPTNKNTNNLTHRVVEINYSFGEQKGLFFTTRGDANKTNDMPISSEALVGKVVYSLPKIGGVLFFIKENWLISIIFITSLLGFIWVVRSYIITIPTQKNAVKRKKRIITSSGDNIKKLGGNKNE